MGIGMVVIVKPKDQLKALEILQAYNYSPRVIGEVTNTEGVVIK